MTDRKIPSLEHTQTRLAHNRQPQSSMLKVVRKSFYRWDGHDCKFLNVKFLRDVVYQKIIEIGWLFSRSYSKNKKAVLKGARNILNQSHKDGDTHGMAHFRITGGTGSPQHSATTNAAVQWTIESVCTRFMNKLNYRLIDWYLDDTTITVDNLSWTGVRTGLRLSIDRLKNMSHYHNGNSCTNSRNFRNSKLYVSQYGIRIRTPQWLTAPWLI